MRNVDGLARKTSKKVRVQTQKREIKKLEKEVVKSANKIRLLRFVDARQAATIAMTFVITFAISIATSQGLAAINPSDSATTNDAPQTAYRSVAVTISGQPESVPQFDLNVLTTPGEVFLPREKLTLPDPLQKRKEFLETYLRSKGSPLADHVDAISAQSQWKLIIGISRAESSFCKHQVSNNCWGIGGAWNMKNYKDFDQAVTDVNRILEQHYIQAGLDTPKEIEKKYVGYPSKNWETAVQQELDALANVD